MPRILVAIDGSEASDRAAAFVDRFFAGMDVAITAVNVARNPGRTVLPVPYGGVHPWPPPMEPTGERSALQEAMAREEAAATAVAAEHAPADADVEVVFGEAVEAISRAAEDENADLIVVGSGDIGFVQRLLGSSVADRLAHEAPRPVLIVR
ncbi:MAG: universal stress protein [Acidimicrobiia bacterium]